VTEADRAHDRVVFEIDHEQFGSAGSAALERRRSRVERQQPIPGTERDAVHRHEAVRRIARIERVDELVRKRDGDAVDQLGERCRSRCPIDARKAQEDAAVARGRDAGGPVIRELGDDFRP